MYFEDFKIGQIFHLDPITLPLEEIKEFAEKYDPLPIHLDINYAQESRFKGIIASGSHTLCAIMGQWVRLQKTGAEVIAGVGIDYLKWTAPVYPNDCLTGEVSVVNLIPSKKGEHGVLVIKVTAYNQNYKMVLDMQVMSLMKCRNFNSNIQSPEFK